MSQGARAFGPPQRGKGGYPRARADTMLGWDLDRGREAMTDPDCIFCRIADGEIPGDIVYDDDEVVAFRDISPQAPTHILIIPRDHIPSVNELADGHKGLAGHMTLVARDLADAEGVSESGYRLVLNTGDDGGQAVHHIHMHLLAGRSMGWPPG